MEKKIYFLSEKLLWAFVLVEIAMFSSATNLTTTESSQETPVKVEHNVTLGSEEYAWSAWSSWSACSRSCGGGVSVQKRQCLPRLRNIPPLDNSSIAPPVITVRVTRETHEPNCQGIDKRYHECNNIPCPGEAKTSRAAQCAAYDKRPFRGRFYTWIPYIDGDAPCTLNCRPLGQHFYASLALVADGTLCTQQGYRAICVQGTCKAVGRDGVLSSALKAELHCGRRLVSGLFSRPHLLLGYSYVTTVPRGACRLNVSEIMPSENYIALKITNGSYIINGEFAVSTPGTYQAAGVDFVYSRKGSVDVIVAHGPIHQPVDIMILYTQPNPSIRYEYFTDSQPGHLDSEAATKIDFPVVTPKSRSSVRHTRRRYEGLPRKNTPIPKDPETNNSVEGDITDVVLSRNYIWKILSYSQCTRSCGGGFQLGKFRCVETSTNREVTTVHCSGNPPVPRRRKCASMPCPARWRAAAWSMCPSCGPATKHRIVGCVQDHSRGITKINDQYCLKAKPPTSEKCDIPDCDRLNGGEVRQITSKRVARPREHTDTFREGPVYTVTVNNTELDVGPEYTFSATAGWLSTEWSECVGWCVGGGVQSRGVSCADPSGCSPELAPETFRSCIPKTDCEALVGHWFTGQWSPCSSPCRGKQIRAILCIGGTGRHLKDSACHDPRPADEQDCSSDCKPTWYYSDWGKCSGNCLGDNLGIQRRSVVCARGDTGGVVNEIECGIPQGASRTCDLTCEGASSTARPVKVATTVPAPPLTIESQRVADVETTQKSTISSQKTPHFKDRSTKGICVDKLNNCILAVQARLCHYKFYINNCCYSCGGR